MASAIAQRNPWRKTYRGDEHVTADDHELRGGWLGVDGMIYPKQFMTIICFSYSANRNKLKTSPLQNKIRTVMIAR